MEKFKEIKEMIISEKEHTNRKKGLNKDEYVKIYQFCKDVYLRRGLKVRFICI